MHGRRALFAPADVQPAGVDLHLVPLQIAKLGSSKPVAVGQQDHGGVPVAIAAVLARGLHERLDLAACEIAPGADNLGIYNAWRFAMTGADVNEMGPCRKLTVGN